MLIRRNDIVLVLSGKDRLKTGKVLRVVPSTGRIVVEGVGIVKRHVKARGNVPGGILSSEAPISASSVRLLERPDTQGMAATKLPASVLKRMKNAPKSTPAKTAAKKAPAKSASTT